MTERLEGKRILVTQADGYMGPAITDMFRKHGAEVIEDRSDPTDPDAAASAVSDAGHIDVLIANLADARFGASAMETDQEAWHSVFDIMVHPLHRLRLAKPEEDALFALVLASDESDFFVGQAVPFSGGWAQ
jgi:2-keto-3-deoxy-L-fuconate dehydrogenase